MRVECEEECKEEFNLNQVPSLYFYAPEEDLEKRTETRVEFTLDAPEFEARNVFESDNIVFSNDQTFKEDVANSGEKPIIIYLYENQMDVAFQLASIHPFLKGKVNFIGFKRPHKDYLSALEVDSLPKMVIMKAKQAENEKNLIFNEDLVYFRVVNLAMQYLKVEYFSLEEVFDSDQEVEFYSGNRSFRERCGKKDKLCLIGLLDKNDQGEEHLKHISEMQDSIEKIANRHVKFGWVNARCHSETAKAFKITEEHLPTVIFYSPKVNKFGKLIGSFRADTIAQFAKRMLAGELPVEEVERKSIVIERKQCKGLDSWEKEEL